ncbi:transmembrane protein 41A-A-like isoform X1 [Dreissena polymorpha]|uniref:transmembrane protein 41A-A-like isoform X1 n=1 Tax=Dreissena polymorpha TaxID=45954 RepID=UPI002263E144|nr:transmembrane protein 41A-A-like isoform X1 [Dreissena polymorpha]
MASVLWIPVVFTTSCLLIYLLASNLPEHTGSDRSALKFPRNLDELKALATLLDDYHDDNMLYVLILYCSAYMFKQTFAIPGSFFMNLLGGAIFGLWYGFPLTCLLSASGASCCYLLSRHFGKDYIVKYFPDKVGFMQKKVSDNSDSLFFFLLFLRLFPMTPNWFLNMVSPILNIPIHLFFISVFIVGEYRHIIQRKKQEKDQVSKELTINTQKPPSKRTAMDMISHLAKRQRQDHVDKLDSVQTGWNKE